MLTFVLILALAQQPQTVPPQPPQPTSQPLADQPQPDLDPAIADIAITATVTARELRHEEQPVVRVTFTGSPGRLTEWSSERTNLPEKVQPKVIYRDIGIRLKIVSVFADIEQIVDEALGLVPPRTETPQPKRP